MIESMTGFGRANAQLDGLSVAVEIRSVNNRFCEVSTRVPRVLAPFDGVLQSRIRNELSRGKINVSVQITQGDETAVPLNINEEAARSYMQLLERLRQAAGIEAPVQLDHLLKFSDILVPVEEDTAAAERVWSVVEKAVAEAIEDIRAMRRQEGVALQKDMDERIDVIEEQLVQVEQRAPHRLKEARLKLQERVHQLIEEDRVDPNRLELEIVLYADKLDITEECVRLRSHLSVFRDALKGGEAVGRKLNFLVQEINREVNTIGSKANDAGIAHLAVAMKEELEKIREQVQNIE